MELKDLQHLIKFVAKSGVSEVSIEKDDYKVTIRKEFTPAEQTVVLQQPQVASVAAAPAPVAAPAAAAPVAAAGEVAVSAETDDDSGYITIKSPMIGTFYRRPSPDKANFVEVGDSIKEGDVICIVEAMKLFNEIEAEVSGTIVKTLVDDSSPIEYDQPLFLIDPS